MKKSFFWSDLKSLKVVVMKKWTLIVLAYFLPQMFVQIISPFCFIIFRICSSIPIWTRSGKWQKAWEAVRTSKRARSSTSVEKGPWESTQMAEAARYRETRGELFSFGAPQKGRLLCARRAGCWHYPWRCPRKACRMSGSVVANHRSVCDVNLSLHWSSIWVQAWALLSLTSNPHTCSILSYVLGLKTSQYAGVVHAKGPCNWLNLFPFLV